MAKNGQTTEQTGIEKEKKRLADERKKLKQEQKIQKKEAHKRAKEISKQESQLSDESEGSPISSFLVTVIIILIWLAIVGLLIKLDVGGFGTKVLRPILKDVPVVNLILPKDHETETEDSEGYYGYTSLRDAVDQIKVLEQKLDQAQTLNNANEEEIKNLNAEVTRLKEFEANQVEFARIKQEFFEEVVYAQNGPGADAYVKYFEAMDEATAEYLYKQVVIQQQKDQKLQDYAMAYSSMKPKAAAAIFENMEDDLELVADILSLMSAEDRGDILGAMNGAIAAKITKIMNPDS